MSQRQEQDGKMTDEMTLFAFVAVFGISVYLFWLMARYPIVAVAFGLDWLQLKALDMLGMLSPPLQQMNDDIIGYVDGRYNPNDVTFDYLAQVEKVVGKLTKWFWVCVIALMGVLVAFRMKGDGYRREFSLTGQSPKRVFRFIGVRINNKFLLSIIKLLLTITFTRKIFSTENEEWVRDSMSFIDYQAKEWRVALSGAKFDPNVKDDNQAPQKTPMVWMRDNKVAMTRRDGLDVDAAEQAFAEQLGPSWNGIQKAELHVQALAVLFALNLKRDKNATKVRDRLTEIYILNNGDRKMVRELIQPFMKNKSIVNAINKVASQHAFTNPAMVRVYGWGGPMQEWGGGKAGVLSTSMFRWLKSVDRTLWYALNNVGRRAFHVEAAGVISHFFWERIKREAEGSPQVEQAVEGLDDYLEKQGLEDIDDYFNKLNEKDFE